MPLIVLCLSPDELEGSAEGRESMRKSIFLFFFLPLFLVMCWNFPHQIHSGSFSERFKQPITKIQIQLPRLVAKKNPNDFGHWAHAPTAKRMKSTRPTWHNTSSAPALDLSSCSCLPLAVLLELSGVNLGPRFYYHIRSENPCVKNLRGFSLFGVNFGTNF